MFVAFLVAQIIALIHVYTKGEIYADEVTGLIKELLVLYSVPMSVMVGGISANRWPKKDTSRIFWVALILVLLWNSLFAWRLIAFDLIGNGDTNLKLIAYFREIAYGSFIIA